MLQAVKQFLELEPGTNMKKGPDLKGAQKAFKSTEPMIHTMDLCFQPHGKPYTPKSVSM